MFVFRNVHHNHLITEDEAFVSLCFSASPPAPNTHKRKKKDLNKVHSEF